MSRKKYQGNEIDISFDGALCIHSRECVTSLPKVFVANAPGDWIQPDEASPEDIEAVARNCPSGAIRYHSKNPDRAEKPPQVNRVKVLENGPLAFHADLRLEDEPSGYRLTLCRCGASKNKPYCDGSHTEAGFTATGEPPSAELPTLEERAGPLQIKAAPSGPLLVSGPLEIMAGSGRALQRTTNTALCRCGASDNKPYCDGSHTRIRFRTD